MLEPHPLIIDAHEDLAWNMLTFGRDYTLSAAETRQREAGTPTPSRNGDTLLGWPDYQRGRVAIVFATLFAAPKRAQEGDWDKLHYATFDQAHTLYRMQVDAYRRLCEAHPAKFSLIETRHDLQTVLHAWEVASPQADQPPPAAPVGLVMLMEGGEGVRHPAELPEWWQLGVRIIGPAWMATRYCGGMKEPGPLTPDGYALLDAMAEIGFGLDLSHMDSRAALQALDHYPATLLASHANAAALLKDDAGNRHLPDAVIRGLIERQGVIGVVPLNQFLLPGWKRGDDRRRVGLQHLGAHIDYICQMAGDAHHVGLGTDFDGGYGLQSVSAEIDTIADLQNIAPLLAEKGYTASEIAAILGGNWRNLLEKILAEAL